MGLLTQGEYDWMPDEVKRALAGVVIQPEKDKKSDEYRRRKGRFMNGEIDADLRTLSRVGYGSGRMPRGDSINSGT
jgi:hypothetical protein